MGEFDLETGSPGPFCHQQQCIEMRLHPYLMPRYLVGAPAGMLGFRGGQAVRPS